MTAREAIPHGVWLMVAGIWGVFLAGMYLAGELPLFQAAPYHHLTGWAGILLVLLALKSALWPARLQCACGHQHAHGESCATHQMHDSFTDEPRPGERRHGLGKMTLGILLVLLGVLPVLAGTLIPHHSLSAFAAIKRGLGSGALDSSRLLDVYRTERRHWAATAGKYADLNPLEVLQATAEHPGLKVRTVGFVYRSDKMPKDILTVTRFKITCCAADATPISVAVRTPKAATFADDTWLEVRGTVHREKIEGRMTTVIDAEDVREVPVPDQPYI